MAKFRKKKKLAIIEAVCWEGTNWEDMNELLPRNIWRLQDGSLVNNVDPMQDLIIQMLEGDMRVGIGDWIIKGAHGEFSVCKPDVFRQNYEVVSNLMGGVMMIYIPGKLYVIRKVDQDQYWHCSIEHGAGWHPHYPKQSFSKSELTKQIFSMIEDEVFTDVVILQLYVAGEP